MIAPAAAADLFGSGPALTYPPSEAATAVEVGTNWYVRADLGIAFDESPSITLPAVSAALSPLGAPTWSTNGSASAGFAGGVGVGYRVNNYVRFDGTWTYWSGVDRTRSLAAGCPFAGPADVYRWGGGVGAYARDPNQTCTDSLSLQQHNNAFLANAYGDLGTYGGFTPYVGGGVGANMHTMKGSATFVGTEDSTGAVTQFSNRVISATTWRFAWSLTAGFGFQLSPSFTLEVGYRYLNGGPSSLLINPMTGLSLKQNNAAQMVTIGVRFVPQ